MIIAVAVAPDGTVGHSWGKAPSVVVARVEEGQILDWQPYDVDWDRSHDEGTAGSHHARIVTFLRAHAVEAVLVDHVGDGMRRMLGSMGIRLVEGIGGDARAAALGVG